MMDLSFMEEMLVPVVMAACLVAGFVLKKWCPTDNKWIPTILVALGAVLGCVANMAISLEFIVAGAVTGLASTGLHQAFKQTLGLGKPTVDEEAEAMIRRDMEEAALLKSGTVAIATDDVPDDALEPNEDGSVNVYDSQGNKAGTVPAEVAEKLAGEVTHVLVDGELREAAMEKAEG